MKTIFVCLGQEANLNGSSRDASMLLTVIRDQFGPSCQVLQCLFRSHASYGRGSAAFLEWREPPTNFADALIVAPLKCFTEDTYFEVRRPPTAFAVPVLILHRCDIGKSPISIDNVSIAADPDIVTSVIWRNGNLRYASRVIGSFLHNHGIVSV
jgi:hypothetical protein